MPVRTERTAEFKEGAVRFVFDETVTDALEMAIWNRRTQLVDGVIAHSDAGGQYVSVRYTERREIGARPSIGSMGATHDNALVESFNGIYKTELIRRCGPLRNADHVPPVKVRDVYYRQIPLRATAIRS